MPRLSVVVLPALMLLYTTTLAQERGIELQGGIGYVHDSDERPSVPAVNAGVVGWVTGGWGVGVRLTEGLTDDEIRQSVVPGDLRLWAVTSQWRWIAHGTEVNAGVGGGRHSYRFKNTETGQRASSRTGSGFLALDLLVGRHVAGPLHVKGGFTFGLGRDLFPFQPVVMLAFKP